MFSQESSQVIFEMGNVEFIELKTSRIQCLPCLHYVCKGTILCACGKHIRPDQEMIRHINAAFEILKAPFFRASVVTSRRYKHGPNLWQEHHHKAKDALRGTKKAGRTITSIWDRWQKNKIYRKSQIAIGRSDPWARYLDHIAQFGISHKATQEQRSRHHNLLYLRSVDEDRQSPPWSTRPGYQEAKNALVEMQRQSRQDLGIPFISKRERQRLGNQLDPSLQRYPEWLSTNWAEYFAKERERRAHLLPLLSALQHPGRAHTRGLQTGKDGINTVGRMTNGQGKGDRQHRHVFKKKSVLVSRNWLNTASKRPTRSCYRQEPKDLTAILSYFFELRFASSQTQLTERDVGCTQNHLTGRAHRHIFLVRTPQGIIRTFPMWAHHNGSR